MKKQAVLILAVLGAELVFWATALGQQTADPHDPDGHLSAFITQRLVNR
jgi:hypothetical protein